MRGVATAGEEGQLLFCVQKCPQNTLGEFLDIVCQHMVTQDCGLIPTWIPRPRGSQVPCTQEARHLRAIGDPPILISTSGPSARPVLWPESTHLSSQPDPGPGLSVPPSQTLSQTLTSLLPLPLLPLTAPVPDGRHGQVYIVQTTPSPCSHILHGSSWPLQ